jgi:hypothetical protein
VLMYVQMEATWLRFCIASLSLTDEAQDLYILVWLLSFHRGRKTWDRLSRPMGRLDGNEVYCNAQQQRRKTTGTESTECVSVQSNYLPTISRPYAAQTAGNVIYAKTP